jgi:large subunit ribosomal protein L2
MVGYSFDEITTTTPEKSLTKKRVRSGGRNHTGRVTSRFIGGGHKQRIRILDHRGYDKAGIPATVASIEYDPNRTARIALLNYADGEKRYVLAWKNAKVGATVMTGPDAPIAAGNRKQLKEIPEGLTVYNLEVNPQTKGKLIKSAGGYATISGKDTTNGLVFIKLPSGEVRKFHDRCRATIGAVGNEDHKLIELGKAGRKRWMGKKPRLIGLNTNPVDHPHGGGEQHKGIGRKHKKMFSGKVVDPGMKTRKKKKWSDKFIISRKKNKQSKK